MVEVCTARMGVQDADVVDITRTGADHRPQYFGAAFAPSARLLSPFLHRRREGVLTDADWERYVEGYTAEMRASFRVRGASWRELLSRPRVVLACFCTDAERCHRTVLGREILPRLGARYVGEILRTSPQLGLDLG